jgi:hypothetical protein
MILYTSFRQTACVFGYEVDFRKSNLFSETRSILANVNTVILVFDHAVIVLDGHNRHNKHNGYNRHEILCMLRLS